MLKNKFHQAKSKKNALFFLAFCITCMIVAISIPVFAKEEPVKSITIESENLSYEENKPGSYKITKPAEWIGKGKARITFQVDTKELIKENINTDTILIIDTSGSMTGDKLDKVKSDSVDLIQKTLQDNNDKIGIIEFNDNASIVSNFDTSNVTNMGAMFEICSSLTELNLSNLETSKVTNMAYMFSYCSNLKLIDFRNATFNATTFMNMFRNISELNVTVKDETARSWMQDKLGSNGTAIIAS